MTVAVPHPERKGLLFREKPFYLSLMFPTLTNGVVQEKLLMELVREHLYYNMYFGIKELPQ